MRVNLVSLIDLAARLLTYSSGAVRFLMIVIKRKFVG